MDITKLLRKQKATQLNIYHYKMTKPHVQTYKIYVYRILKKPALNTILVSGHCDFQRFKMYLKKKNLHDTHTSLHAEIMDLECNYSKSEIIKVGLFL